MERRRLGRTWVEHVRFQWRGYVMAIAVMVALAGAAASARSGVERLILERQDVTEWVEYAEVRYLTTDHGARGGLGALHMSSTFTVHREVEMTWRDELRCTRVTPSVRTGDFELVSSFVSSGVRTPRPETEVF